MPARNENSGWAGIGLCVVLGLFLGAGLRSFQVARHLPATAASTNQSGAAIQIGAAEEPPAKSTGEAAAPIARPLGLSPGDLLANLTEILERGLLQRSENVHTRLALILEAGPEGRQALLEFIRSGEDYQAAALLEVGAAPWHLRDYVLHSMRRAHTREGEEMMQYVLDTTPELSEALLAADALKDWEVKVPPERLEGALRGLAQGKLQHLISLPVAPTEIDGLFISSTADNRERREGLEQVAKVVLSHGAADLLPQLEQAYLRHHQQQSSGYRQVLRDLPGEAQARAIQRVGLESPLLHPEANLGSFLETLDFAQPAVRELALNLVENGNLGSSETKRFLEEEYLFQCVTRKFASFTIHDKEYPTARLRDQHRANLDGLEQVITTIRDNPALDGHTREVAARRLGTLNTERQRALERPVRGQK